jgi:hypothetical protein
MKDDPEKRNNQARNVVRKLNHLGIIIRLEPIE